MLCCLPQGAFTCKLQQLCCKQVVALLLRNIKLGNPWEKVDLCTGKLVEIGGD